MAGNVFKCLEGWYIQKKVGEKSFGDGGYRSPYLSHAKRALYHLSYVPMMTACAAVSLSHIPMSRAGTVK